MQSMKSLGKQHIFYVESKLFQLRESIEGLGEGGTRTSLLNCGSVLCMVCYKLLYKADFKIKSQFLIQRRKKRKQGRR
jgi:hypothetical protein